MTRKGEYSPPWTPIEHTKLMSLHAQLGPKWKEISARLPGRSASACQTRHHDFNEGGGYRRSRGEVKAAVAAARQALPEHSSLTAAFFGDPLPGRSALDKRKAQAGVRSISLAGAAL